MPAAGSTNGRSNRASMSKATPSTLMVALKLSPDLLLRFVEGPVDQPPSTQPKSEKGTERSSPVDSAADATLPRPSSADNASDADATSTPAAGATPGDTPRRKGVPGPKPGNKRTNGQTEPTARARGRPGPKKKPRLEDGDTSKLTANHRLGPKANTGAINAGLRALDRTGAPCRKWDRQPFKLRSFTGVLWQVPAWHTFKTAQIESEDNKEAVLESGDSDTKPTLAPPGPDTANASSAVPSEKSTGDGDLTPAPSNVVEPSSPAIAMAA